MRSLKYTLKKIHHIRIASMHLNSNTDMHMSVVKELDIINTLIFIGVMFMLPVSSGLHHLKLKVERDLNGVFGQGLILVYFVL